MDNNLWQIKVHAKSKKQYSDNKRLIEMLKMGYNRLLSFNIKKDKIMIQIVKALDKDKYVAKRFEDKRLPSLKELNNIDENAKWKGFIFYYYNDRELSEF